MNTFEFPRNCWYPILESKHLMCAKPLPLTRLGVPLVAWRDTHGHAVVFNDRCPHRGARLSLGKIKGDRLECSYHGFQFEKSGNCSLIPAYGAQKAPLAAWKTEAYVTQERAGLLWMWWGTPGLETPLKVLEDFSERLPPLYPNHSTRSLEVPLSFFRVVESHMDVYHSAFVHRFAFLDLLSRFSPWIQHHFLFGPVVKDINVDRDSELVQITGKLQHSHDDPPALGHGYRNWMIFPNQTGIELQAWQSRGAFFSCPIDSEKTWFAGRWSCEGKGIPLIRSMVSWILLKRLLGGIWKQDERVLTSQTPRICGKGSDRLIFADQGIAAFWDWIKTNS